MPTAKTITTIIKEISTPRMACGHEVLVVAVGFSRQHLSQQVCRRGTAKGFGMSALPPKADIHRSDWNVRFVPNADIRLVSLKWRAHCCRAAPALQRLRENK